MLKLEKVLLLWPTTPRIPPTSWEILGIAVCKDAKFPSCRKYGGKKHKNIKVEWVGGLAGLERKSQINGNCDCLLLSRDEQPFLGLKAKSSRQEH